MYECRNSSRRRRHALQRVPLHSRTRTQLGTISRRHGEIDCVSKKEVHEFSRLPPNKFVAPELQGALKMMQKVKAITPRDDVIG